MLSANSRDAQMIVTELLSDYMNRSCRKSARRRVRLGKEATSTEQLDGKARNEDRAVSGEGQEAIKGKGQEQRSQAVMRMWPGTNFIINEDREARTLEVMSSEEAEGRTMES
jgi:hypothetical protein